MSMWAPVEPRPACDSGKPTDTATVAVRNRRSNAPRESLGGGQTRRHNTGPHGGIGQLPGCC
eukprot:5066163-Lingulodinium_polyedra.AAC.1